MHVGNEETEAPANFYVAGIGASAGGLAAIKRFLREIPEKTGIAFVIVVHLAPEHESFLSDLLQPMSKMPVSQVTTEEPLEPNHVYVIPPGRNLSSIDTHLRLSPLEPDRRLRAPIDHFLGTLAETHGRHAVGIILSGSGSDGAAGLKKIKPQAAWRWCKNRPRLSLMACREARLPVASRTAF